MCLTTQAGDLLKVQNFESKEKYFSREGNGITSIRPYEYVDIMLSGPFKRWKHVHKFLYDIEQNQTEVVNGLVGKMLEGFATNQLRKIYHRRRPHYKTVYEHVELLNLLDRNTTYQVMFDA